MVKRFCSFIYVLALIVISAVQLCPIQVYAANNCTLTVEYSYEDCPLTNADFKIYRFAAPSGTNSYVLCGGFVGYPVDVNISDADGMRQLAATLRTYVTKDGIMPFVSGVTDIAGEATFTMLEPGLYLVLGSQLQQDGYNYTCDPTVVMLPGKNASSGAQEYDVTVTPKVDREPIPSEPMTVTRKVLKAWSEDAIANRPDSVAVELLCDGDVYETVTLSAANNWRHTWTGLDASKNWLVLEQVPDGYTMSVSQEGVTFLITNTAVPLEEPGDPETPDKTDDPDEPIQPELPQTGQLWWPVPLLVAAGITLIAIGYIRRRGAHDEE